MSDVRRYTVIAYASPEKPYPALETVVHASGPEAAAWYFRSGIERGVYRAGSFDLRQAARVTVALKG